MLLNPGCSFDEVDDVVTEDYFSYKDYVPSLLPLLLPVFPADDESDGVAVVYAVENATPHDTVGVISPPVIATLITSPPVTATRPSAMHAAVQVGMEVPPAMHAGGVNLPRTSMHDVAYVNQGVPAIHAVGTSAMHAAGHFMPVATAPPEYRDFVRPTPSRVARQRGVDPALTYGRAQLMRQQLANDAVLPVAQPTNVIEDWPEPPHHEPEVNVYHSQPLTWQAPDLNIYPPTHVALSGRSVDPNTLSMAQL